MFGVLSIPLILFKKTFLNTTNTQGISGFLDSVPYTTGWNQPGERNL